MMELNLLAQLMGFSLKGVLVGEGLQPTMKWPNDLLLNGKKVAGVLCEMVSHADAVEVILGVGLNVNMEEEDLKKIDQAATSLKHETGRIWDKTDLLKKIQVQFLFDLDQFKNAAQPKI